SGLARARPIVLGGSSYGGYLATRAAVACGARGIVVLSGFFSFSDLRESTHEQVREFVSAFLNDEQTSTPPPGIPVFVAHGEGDERIPLDAVRGWEPYFVDGSDVTYLSGEGHAVRSDFAARQVYPRLFEWLDRL